MKSIQVPERGADFQLVEREIPEPGPGQVRIRVLACGVCHSDVVTKDGLFPGIAYPRVPGHDGTCLACRRGDFASCVHVKTCGIDYDGGYQEFMVAPVEALARMPESLDAVEAAPLMCAGNTTFTALRHSGAVPGDLVAVQGIGGLGHLAVQFAKQLGFRVAAIGRGPYNGELAKTLGADVYVDSVANDAARELQKLGGARVILSTAPSGKAMSPLIGGLVANGALIVVGASAEPLDVTPNALIFGRKRIQGWLAGTPTDTEDTLRFAGMTGVRPIIERYPLARAAEAYTRMLTGKAEFRAVLTM